MYYLTKSVISSGQAITLFGLQRRLDVWKKPGGIFKRLRQLTRERDQLIQHRTMTKNQLHAEEAEAEPNKGSVIRFKKQIVFFNKQEQEIKAEINALIKQDEKVSEICKTDLFVVGNWNVNSCYSFG